MSKNRTKISLSILFLSYLCRNLFANFILIKRLKAEIFYLTSPRISKKENSELSQVCLLDVQGEVH